MKVGKAKKKASSTTHGTEAVLYDSDFIKQIFIKVAGGSGVSSLLQGLIFPEGAAHGVINGCSDHAEIKLLAGYLAEVQGGASRNLGIALNEYPCEHCHVVLKALTTSGHNKAQCKFDRIRVRMESTSLTYKYAHQDEPALDGAQNGAYGPPVMIEYREGVARYHPMA